MRSEAESLIIDSAVAVVVVAMLMDSFFFAKPGAVGSIWAYIETTIHPQESPPHTNIPFHRIPLLQSLPCRQIQHFIR